MQFYTTSLTWSRALGVPLVLAVADKEWFFRETHVTDEIRWLEDCKEIGPDVKMIRCGGCADLIRSDHSLTLLTSFS